MSRRDSYAVVIPAHNEARFIGDALRSVHAQSVKPSEVIVVDDGSSDDTQRVAAEHGARVVRHSIPRGPGFSRNRGVASASAPLVAFLDADDVWNPLHVERLMACASDSGALFFGSRHETFGLETFLSPQVIGESGVYDVRDILVSSNPITQSAVMVRRDAFDAVGGYDETLRLAEDYDLWFRLAARGRFAYLNEVTVLRRLHPQQATHLNRQAMLTAAWRVRTAAVRQRFQHGTAADRSHVTQLLKRVVSADIEMAIWTGSVGILDALRSAVQSTDSELGLGDILTAHAGTGGTIRRSTQNVRCWMHAVKQAIRQRR